MFYDALPHSLGFLSTKIQKWTFKEGPEVFISGQEEQLS